MTLDWLERPLQASPGTPSAHAVSAGVLAVRFGVAFALGCVAAAIHHYTAGARRPDHEETQRTFPATLVLLSVLIALVMIVIGDSIARAFSLAGALAIIRFRTVVEDTRDTAFVMFAVIAGMAAGTGYLVAPVLCTPLVLLAAWAFRPRPRPERRGTDTPTRGLLVLRLAAGRSPDERLQAALGQHLQSLRLVALSTARGGSALDATYAVDLPPADRVYAMVQDLSRVEGVQGVELKEDPRGGR